MTDFDYDSYPPTSGTMDVMRVVMRNKELERLGAMTCANHLDAEDASKMSRLNAADLALVNFAAKLFRGEPHALLTNDPETVHRHRLIARHVGATVEVIEQGGGLTRIHFSPPSRQ